VTIVHSDSYPGNICTEDVSILEICYHLDLMFFFSLATLCEICVVFNTSMGIIV